ncbi:MAG: urease accessory protein UreD, partial [Chloroflexi bacterium]|nr:urease accessory protein UreD [Chloroflexota bacterium]
MCSAATGVGKTTLIKTVIGPIGQACALTNVHLEPRARVFLGQSLSPGRVQFGECFAYRQVRLDLDVRCAGKLVAR